MFAGVHSDDCSPAMNVYVVCVAAYEAECSWRPYCLAALTPSSDIFIIHGITYYVNDLYDFVSFLRRKKTLQRWGESSFIKIF